MDMRALKALSAGKHFLNSNTRPFTRLHPPSSCKCPGFSPHFRSTCLRFIPSTSHRFDDEETTGDPSKRWPSSPGSLSSSSASRSGTDRGVSTVYDPVSGRLVARRGVNQGNNVGEESNLGGGDSLSSADQEDSFGRKVYWSGNSSSGVVGSKKKRKSRATYVCSNCGYSDGQWWGICKACNNAATMTQFFEGAGENEKSTGFSVSENVLRSWLPQNSSELIPMRLTDVNQGINQVNWRIPLSGLFGAEVATVLGGGLVPGSLVLVGGDPGVGKSTFLLQLAAIVAEGYHIDKSAPVVYVSGEESVEQVGNRADRLKIRTRELYIYTSTDVEDILRKAQVLSPRALVIDSIQTVYLQGVPGSAGGLSQVKECTSALLRFAKKTNISVLLIGHVTKSGEIAGPRVLEHIVDVVLYMEGEKHSSHRLLRSVKNRFGSTDELGVFEMSELGLQAVSNASEMFLSEQYADSEVLAGLAVAAVMDGSRTFLIEIQALCVAGTSVLRQVNGVSASRADMITSVLIKQAGLKLPENGIFLNVISGVTLTETAGDLAIAAAICSSYLEFPIPNGVAFIGEVGLGGELRSVSRMDKRLNTVAKMGYKRCIVPKSAEKSLFAEGFDQFETCGCKDLKEMINKVFVKH